MSRLRDDGDWTYHGVWRSASLEEKARIFVEHTVFGSSERAGIPVLRELPGQRWGGFGWGYNGGGPSRVAQAVLADALELSDSGRVGLGPEREDPTFCLLRQDFCWDVTTQLCDEWRMRRGTVLRWVRGWYAEHDIADLPAAAARLSPASPHG